MKQLSLYLKYFAVLFFLCNYNLVAGTKVVTHDDASEILVQDNYIKVEKKWDEASSTYYYLSKVKHQDQNGNLLKLKLAVSVVDSGETVPQFASRLDNPIITINASTVVSNKPPWPKVSAGTVIANGVIIKDVLLKYYTLGIKSNNELVAYRSYTPAQQILDDGAVHAVTGFIPLIEDFKPVANNILILAGNHSSKHPRQLIAQFGNLDLLILSCGGRGFDGAGMTAADMIRILQGLEDDVKFAYNLDGGGSTTTVIYGNQITKMIDNGGKENRTRANCLYVAPNDSGLIAIENIGMNDWKDSSAVPDGFSERGRTDATSYLGYLSKATEKFNGVNAVKMTYATSTTDTGVYMTTPYVQLSPGNYELTYNVKGSGFLSTVNLMHQGATEPDKQSHSPLAPSVSKSPMGSMHNPILFTDWTKYTVHYSVTEPSMYALCFTHNNYGGNAAIPFLLSGIAMRKLYKTSNTLAPIDNNTLNHIFSQGRRITIELNGFSNTMLSITDVMGRNIIKTYFSQSIEVIVPAIGVYLVTVGLKTYKLVVSDN